MIAKKTSKSNLAECPFAHAFLLLISPSSILYQNIEQSFTLFSPKHVYSRRNLIRESPFLATKETSLSADSNERVKNTRDIEYPCNFPPTVNAYRINLGSVETTRERTPE